MDLRWNESLAIGIDAVDQQHRLILVRMRALLEALNNPALHENAAVLLLDLEQEVFSHLDSEELHIRELGYPGVGQHAAAHARLRDYLGKLGEELSVRPGNPRLLDTTSRLFASALINHMDTYDRDLATYLHEEKLSWPTQEPNSSGRDHPIENHREKNVKAPLPEGSSEPDGTARSSVASQKPPEDFS